MRHWLPFVLVAGLSVSCTRITREFDPMDFHSPSSSYLLAPYGPIGGAELITFE